MISISKSIARLASLLVLLLVPQTDLIGSGITLSVSPVTYELAVEPGRQLSSSIRVINPNPFDLTVYAEVANFRPRDEGGAPSFHPIDFDNAEGITLAEWFTISEEPIIVPREQSRNVPFTINVPEAASPGGHFAAIMIGTRPLRSEVGESQIKTAQIVTSLVFLRVAGEVIESGSIREFTTTKRLYRDPTAEFSLRFENRGNVHIQPQGEIKIFNMWGKDRGTIPINQLTNLGHVLPGSVRQFRFAWRGEWSPYDIGRYRAVVTVVYGAEERRFASSEIDFWILPVGLIVKVLGVIVLIILLIIWLVKLYVRRMLRLAGIDVNALSLEPRSGQTRPASLSLNLRYQLPNVDRIAIALSKLKSQSALLRKRLSVARLRVIYHFLIESRLWLVAIPIVGLLIFGLWYLSKEAKETDHRAFEVGYLNYDQTVTVTSEEIAYNLLRSQVSEADATNISTVPISIINRGGIPGRGAEVRLALERAGYEIVQLKADFVETNPRTVIVTSREQEDTALALSRLLNNALVSFTAETDATITVYVGAETFAF